MKDEECMFSDCLKDSFGLSGVLIANFHLLFYTSWLEHLFSCLQDCTSSVLYHVTNTRCFPLLLVTNIAALCWTILPLL